MIAPLFGSITRPLLSPLVSGLRDELFGAFTPRSLFNDGSIGVLYDNNDFVDSATWRRNLYTYTEQLQNAAWYAASSGTFTVATNSSTDPLGGSTADVLTTSASGFVYVGQNVTCNVDTYTATFRVKLISGSGQAYGIIAGTSGSSITLTSDWQTVTVTVAVGSAGVKQTGLVLPNSAQVAVWGAQIERASAASDYQRITDFNTEFLAAFPNTTLFLDAAGTTPATVNGLVGMQLDKSGNGFHRTQATTGSKPVLRGTPVGSSLVTNGDFASGTGWTTGAGWAIGSGVATATTSSGTLTSTLAATESKNYRVTYTITRSAGSVQVSFGGRTGASRSAAGTYVDYLDSTTNTNALVFTGTTFSGTVDNVEVVDVSAGQVTAPYGLQYDGVDDFLQTAAVDFTATDKMFVCAGLMNGAATGNGMILESSVNADSNNGAIYVYKPAESLQVSLRGTAIARLDKTVAMLANARLVFSASFDIAGASATDEIVPRINQVGTGFAVGAAGPAGTGNLGNYAMYFGRRAGTSLPYTGLDFGFVIVGKTLTAAQISSTERWMAQRTGVTL